MHKAQQLRKNALIELDHTELHQVLKRPNPAQSYNAWLQEIIAFGKLTGNRYIFGIAPETGMNKGKYKELYVLPSQNMEIHSGGIMQPVKEYTLSYNGTYKIAADDICHIKDFNPYYDGTGSHLYGMSPLHSGLRVLQANNEAVTTGVKYLQNQMARGVLMSEEGDLNEEQARMLKDKFKQQYQGANNAGDVIITPKKLSWINFGLSTSDLSLIEQYNASIKDLCNIYSVPVQLLNNTESSTYNNMKEAKKALYQNAVIPELIKIREELNRWLTPKYGENLYIDFDFSVIPELQEEMDKVVAQMSNAWWITPNEKRAAMSYGVDEDSAFMNDYYIPANLIPTQNLPDLIDEPDSMPNASQPMDTTDVFSSQAEAEARAEQLGGEGFHTHMTESGETVFMPFASHEEYQAAINKGFFLTNKQPQISAAVERGLRNKVDEHNDEYGDDPAKRATYGMLAECFRRGVGAYNTNPQSVRPSVTSADQWAYARVNALLYALRNGRFRGARFDTDLLPEEHPLSTKDKEQKQEYTGYPQSATNNARRMLEWIEEYGRDEVRGGTQTGLARARQIAERRPLDRETINRIYSFFSRHQGNETVSEENRDTPWRDNGFVAWNLWGGTSMFNYVRDIVENED
jgi:HK97 family phage portal protein